MKRRLSTKNPMTSLERRSVSALAGVFGLRMLGLFLILPVFALYAQELQGNTAFLTGVAIGAYGLTQAVFQIPFGLLSDKFGRKPVIAAGLLIFAIGSIVAAMADSITGVIIGRALQGTGAIAAAVPIAVDEINANGSLTGGLTLGYVFGLDSGCNPIKGVLSLTGLLESHDISVFIGPVWTFFFFFYVTLIKCVLRDVLPIVR